MSRGEIIVVEGSDYSGKRTQTKLLFERLKREGVPCETMSFPRYNTPTGKIVGGPYLGKPEICLSWFDKPMLVPPKVASLYYAADRKAAVPEIEEILRLGKHIIMDRYAESNMAHQGAKANTEKERDEIIRFINRLEYELLELPKPKGIIFLHMPLQVVRELRDKRCREERTYSDKAECDDEHLQKAVEVYNFLASTFSGWVRIDCAPDRTINSLKTPEQIHEEVYRVAKSIIGI